MKKPITKSYWTQRLSTEAGNPREVAFAAQWAKEHEHSDLLAKLFDAAKGIRGELPTDDERRAVATVVQWLGSNVGMSFLREALGRCGMTIKEKPDV